MYDTIHTPNHLQSTIVAKQLIQTQNTAHTHTR